MDPDLFYIPYSANKEGETINAAGSLYNHYKYVRKGLRQAQLLLNGRNNDSLTADEPINSKHNIAYIYN